MRAGDHLGNPRTARLGNPFARDEGDRCETERDDRQSIGRRDANRRQKSPLRLVGVEGEGNGRQRQVDPPYGRGRAASPRLDQTPRAQEVALFDPAGEDRRLS